MIFLRNFSQVAFEKQYSSAEKKYRMKQEELGEADYDSTYESHLTKMEMWFMTHIKDQVSQASSLSLETPHYGVPIFW